MKNNKSNIFFALILTTTILVETIGVYVSKETCVPCGRNEIYIDLISYDNEIHRENCCCAGAKCCSNHTENTTHEDIDHEHKKEVQYLNQSPDFFEKSNIIDTKAWMNIAYKLFTPLSTKLPTAELLAYKNTKNLSNVYLDYRVFLCTYLI